MTVEARLPAKAPTLDNHCLVWLLSVAARLSRRRLSASLAPYGVTPSQWMVLVALGEHDELTLGALARSLEIDGPTLTGIADRLEMAELATRRRSREDQRVTYLRLTPAGRALRRVLPALASAVDQQVVAGLSPAQVQHLTHMLRVVIANLASETCRVDS